MEQFVEMSNEIENLETEIKAVEEVINDTVNGGYTQAEKMELVLRFHKSCEEKKALNLKRLDWLEENVGSN